MLLLPLLPPHGLQHQPPPYRAQSSSSELLSTLCVPKCHPSQNTLTVSQEELQKGISAEALMGRAQDLQDIAYATPDRDRAFTRIGFNDTLDYLVDNLKEQTGDYYDIEFWPAPIELLNPAPLTVNGKTYETKIMQKKSGIPKGTFDATPIIVVANEGCAAVSFSLVEDDTRYPSG